MFQIDVLILKFFFCTRGGVSKTPGIHYIKIGRNNFCSMALASIALSNQQFEERALQLFTNTPEIQERKQSTPWVSPPMIAGVLQALPPRNRSK
jgi:hypothetical protein